jgi:hypothetical protein
MLANLAYNKAKKRGSRERSSPPCQIKILILPRCPEARGNIFNPDLNIDSKVLRTLGPRGHASLTDRACAPSNGFRAAVYDSIGPPLAFMTRQKRYPLAPRRLMPSAQTRGGCAAPGTADWPSAAILRWASKWWASPVGESSPRSIKVVEKL